MIFKIKECFLLIFLILLQSCSGGRIGNFLESSFDNTENLKKFEEPKNVLDNKKIYNLKKQEIEKNNIDKIKKEDKSNYSLQYKKVLNLENKSDKTKKTKKVNNSQKKRKSELQSYKIIFILKDVDPKDPIEEFSTILSNSEVNFEIEKIERFLDPKNKNMKRN